MNLFSIKNLLFTITFFSIFPNIKAEITPPNYDFSIATIEPFFPGLDIQKIKSDKSIQSDIYEDNGNLKTLKFKLKKTHYNLDIYVQTKDEKITDMFVRLPQYFIHDLFLTELQKKYKKQDHFVRKDHNALYVWMGRDGNNIIYHASCTITCFPMFIEFVSTDKTITPFYKKFNEAIPKW